MTASKKRLSSLLKRVLGISDKSASRYDYPLPLNPDSAHLDWIDVGRRIADQTPVIPQNQLVINGPFLTCKSPESHTGAFLHAIDFLVPDGTVVIAGADGFIETIADIDRAWGPTKESAVSLNYITLRHCFGDKIERSQYCHLEQNSCRALSLRIGDKVRKGQPLGFVGKTGWTDRDHLHFIVFRSTETELGFESLVPRFNDWDINEGQAYHL